MNHEPVLSVDGLGVRYGARVAVADLSFEIRSGEVFGLLGPNGAGKTSTISCVAGLLRSASGAMRFRGRPFAPRDKEGDRAALGLVPQELSLYEELTARENLRFFARLFGVPRAREAPAIARVLDLSGLSGRAGERVKGYSGGMKRRLNLAIGELAEPALLILDEPTAGVDPQSRNHVFEALGALRASGRALLFTTHYMEEAARLCDRILILDEGRAVAQGSQAEIASAAGVPGAGLEDAFLHLTGRSLRDT